MTKTDVKPILGGKVMQRRPEEYNQDVWVTQFDRGGKKLRVILRRTVELNAELTPIWSFELATPAGHLFPQGTHATWQKACKQIERHLYCFGAIEDNQRNGSPLHAFKR